MNQTQTSGAVVEFDLSELKILRGFVRDTPDEGEVKGVVRSFDDYDKTPSGRAIIPDLYLGPTTASWIRLLAEERVRRSEYSDDYQALHLYHECKRYYQALYPERSVLERLELRGEFR
ncbi:hypothetical protein [Haloarchaeobius sp. DT45]|uniref:hypothetical protein n=1 Tax=Haloarchaeobius sp. DT45 TaxID=3446116 RepID=UPI003F6ABEFA